jgi:hypothetical protein
MASAAQAQLIVAVPVVEAGQLSTSFTKVQSFYKGSIIRGTLCAIRENFAGRRAERMKEERRLVWRVLRYWKEMAHGGRFPRRDEIEPWVQGEDGANLLLIAVQSPIELSHFVVVGVNLAVALCPTHTLADVLLSRVPRVVSARRGRPEARAAAWPGTTRSGVNQLAPPSAAAPSADL